MRLGDRRLRGRLVMFTLDYRFALCEVEREAGHADARGFRIRLEYWAAGDIHPTRSTAQLRGRWVANKPDRHGRF